MFFVTGKIKLFACHFCQSLSEVSRGIKTLPAPCKFLYTLLDAKSFACNIGLAKPCNIPDFLDGGLLSYATQTTLFVVRNE